MSPNLHYIAVVGETMDEELFSSNLCLYDLVTRQCFGPMPGGLGDILWFTQDGCEVWYGKFPKKVDRWKSIEGSESITKLEYLGLAIHQPAELPWQSPYGYQVTDDWWIVNSSGK